MAVYVDPLKAVRPYRAGFAGWRYLYFCHLMADTEKELEGMARRLRLRKGWRDRDHYDLTSSKRAAAVAFGAQEVTHQEMVEIRRRFNSQ